MKTLDKGRTLSPNLRFTKKSVIGETMAPQTRKEKELVANQLKKYEEDKKKAADKRLKAMEYKPKLNLALKMQVVK